MDTSPTAMHVPGVATVACIACRKLKMKCVGSDKPPCARCAKTGRECVVQKPDRNRNSGGNSTAIPQIDAPRDSEGGFTKHDSFRDHPLHGNGYSSPAWRKNGMGSAVSRNFFPVTGVPPTTLPSIYNTSPYSTVFSPLSPSNEASGHRTFKRRRVETNELQTNMQEKYPIPQRDMIELIRIFRDRMMIFIPLLDPSDLNDITHIISHKPTLALCICYVTTRYIPGGDRTRRRLIPHISSILQKQYVPLHTDEEKWSTLQALAILYAYRPSVQETASQTEIPDISHRAIKSFVESYALHLSVHRSITSLKSSIRADEPNIASMPSLKYYMFWLWLFYMAHHFAIVTGTPPSVRIDATIRAASSLLDSELLKKLGPGHGARQILAETELCIHWEEISTHFPGLAEWWCPPDPTDNVLATTHLEGLSNFDKAVEKSLSTWSTKWGGGIHTEPLGQAMDFHFRFTKFCLSTYPIRSIHIGYSNISQEQQIRLNDSVQAANHFCEHLLSLGPAHRDAARYMGDFGFVMISFACLFIIEACKHYAAVIPGLNRLLKNVEEVALLMRQLAINPSSDCGPILQANVILQKLRQLDEPMQDQSGLAEVPAPLPSDTEIFLMDPIWNLMNFFPDVQPL